MQNFRKCWHSVDALIHVYSSSSQGDPFCVISNPFLQVFRALNTRSEQLVVIFGSKCLEVVLNQVSCSSESTKKLTPWKLTTFFAFSDKCFWWFNWSTRLLYLPVQMAYCDRPCQQDSFWNRCWKYYQHGCTSFRCELSPLQLSVAIWNISPVNSCHMFDLKESVQLLNAVVQDNRQKKLIVSKWPPQNADDVFPCQKYILNGQMFQITTNPVSYSSIMFPFPPQFGATNFA